MSIRWFFFFERARWNIFVNKRKNVKCMSVPERNYSNSMDVRVAYGSNWRRFEFFRALSDRIFTQSRNDVSMRSGSERKMDIAYFTTIIDDKQLDDCISKLCISTATLQNFHKYINFYIIIWWVECSHNNHRMKIGDMFSAHYTIQPPENYSHPQRTVSRVIFQKLKESGFM